MIDDNDTQHITEIVNLYFQGTYQGDADKLKRAFHADAHITGSLNGEIHDWTLTDFITRVSALPSAENKEEKYDKEIILIDRTNNAAIVKARVLVGNLIFIDYITLLKTDGLWLIRNKSFTS